MVFKVSIVLHTEPAVPSAREFAAPWKDSSPSSSSLGSNELSAGVVALDRDRYDVPGEVPRGALVAE